MIRIPRRYWPIPPIRPVEPLRYVQAARAVRNGAETSREVAADLGISAKLAKEFLRKARQHGLIEPDGDFHHHDARTAAIRWRAVA